MSLCCNVEQFSQNENLLGLWVHRGGSLLGFQVLSSIRRHRNVGLDNSKSKTKHDKLQVQLLFLASASFLTFTLVSGWKVLDTTGSRISARWFLHLKQSLAEVPLRSFTEI